MNLSGLRRTTRIRSSIIGFMVVFGLVLFSALSGYGEDVRTEGTEKIAKTTLMENPTPPGPAGNRYDLASIIGYALKNNPGLRIAEKDVVSEQYGIDAAKADRIPRIDLGGGITRFRYDTPLTPAVIVPPIGAGTEFPVYRRTIWDTGVSFKLPLFKGGRLYRAVHVAEIKRALAQDVYRINRQELVYNLTSVYYKIVQLEQLLLASDQAVRQLESHKKNAELYLKTGTVAKLDLLKTDVELSHSMENRLLVKNNLAGAYELLRALMGMDNVDTEFSVVPEHAMDESYPALEGSIRKAFVQRPDYQAIAKKRLIYEERVKIAEGKRFPDIYAAGEYVAKAGNDTSFRENWYYGLRFTIPVFDGGLIRAEINKEKAAMEKIKEEERALKLLINREVKDTYLNIDNARERIEVTRKAIDSAQENVRIELLKYDTGAGKSTDVIDAQIDLLRAEIDHYQALFDRETALAFLKKAVGEDEYDGEVRK
jgi:outer membrane protein